MSWLPILAELGRDDRLSQTGGAPPWWMGVLLGVLIAVGIIAIRLIDRRP